MTDKLEPFSMLRKVRERKPLVHHITNWVTIYDCANITRAFGGLPVMAHAPEEVEEMTGIADALVLNIGTLTKELVDAMIASGRKANEKGIPVILDAVGVGATSLRTQSAQKIIREVRPSVVKGNSGEIGVLAGAEAVVRGVEAAGLKGNPVELTKSLASNHGCVAVMTGRKDIVSDGRRVYLVENGHAMMGSIVGTGCMAASVIGCFTAVEADYAVACASALSCFGIAGEIAAVKAHGPGSFKELFYDSVYHLDEATVSGMSKITVDLD